MNDRTEWEQGHRGKTVDAAPEPFLIEVMDLIPRGLALDIASGRGRHAIALARRGFRVVAVDYSSEAIRMLATAASIERLPVFPIVADVASLPARRGAFDAAVNINFLDRALFPSFIEALKIGGVMLAETFLVDQAEIGHPRNPDFLLKHGELRELLAGMEMLRFREGMVTYADGSHAWRASALARKRR